ncbi:divisome protein SepX/GlpR [Kribbella sp. CA-294648]|uniref:divisome protein SepX/GlpR n=1 Tax=Kribbella sp. CA-294648 TaxID=3239948 RepID=UPI003D89C6B5
MGTTGLIYVAIVAAWAAYLVPMLLKRNDEASQRRSAEKYSSSAARVLSRQTDVQARSRYVVRPPGSEVSAGPGGADEVVSDPSPPTRYVPNRARRVAAMRRRRVLSILTLSLLSVTAFAGLGMLAWWTLAVPATLIATFVVLTRVQLRRQARERAALAAERRARAEAHHDRGPATAPVQSPDHEMTIEVTLPVIEEPVVQTKPEPRTDGLWDPVPVTLPTYVMKEKAPDRTVRTISLSGPEVFSSARTADPEPQAAPVVPEPAPAPVEEPEIRRAVGD